MSIDRTMERALSKMQTEAIDASHCFSAIADTPAYTPAQRAKAAELAALYERASIRLDDLRELLR
jgi:hypothetical protein